MGGEVQMVPALSRALRGAWTPEDIISGDLERERVHGFSSENLPQLAAALAYSNARLSDDSYDAGFWREWWMARLAWERQNFMGVELTSRTYGSWHFMAKRAVYELARRDDHADLAAACAEWMLAFLALAAMASGKRPGRRIVDHRIAEPGAIYGTGDEVAWSGRYVAWSGDRCDSRQSGLGEWWGWLTISSPAIWLSLSLGESVGDCDERDVERACGAPWVSGADAAILRGVRDGNFKAGLSYVRPWSPQVPLRICQTDEGVWTLSPVGRGSSTPHAYAVAQWHNTGNIAGLYADPGWRDAGPQDWIVSGSAWVTDNVAWAAREDHKYGSPHPMPLPGGNVLFDFTWEPGVAVDVPKPGTTVPTPGMSLDPLIEEIEVGRKYLLSVSDPRARVRPIHPDEAGRTRWILDREGDPL